MEGWRWRSAVPHAGWQESVEGVRPQGRRRAVPDSVEHGKLVGDYVDPAAGRRTFGSYAPSGGGAGSPRVTTAAQVVFAPEEPRPAGAGRSAARGRAQPTEVQALVRGLVERVVLGDRRGHLPVCRGHLPRRCCRGSSDPVEPVPRGEAAEAGEAPGRPALGGHGRRSGRGGAGAVPGVGALGGGHRSTAGRGVRPPTLSGWTSCAGPSRSISSSCSTSARRRSWHRRRPRRIGRSHSRRSCSTSSRRTSRRTRWASQAWCSRATRD